MKPLSEAEARVLGALIEKDLTTPEYYPLSLNALVNACNQKSNRDPLMTLDDAAVSEALRTLEKQELAGPADAMDNRVRKFEHRLQEVFNFDRRETAVVCELLLRGPQTPGELRGRAGRMHPFEDLQQVQSTLQRLMQRDSPIVKVLPRQPGTKEARYAHLFSGNIDIPAQPPPQSAKTASESAASHEKPDSGRISRLEAEVASLHNELVDIKQQLADFRKQFD